ncbi:tape measure protein [Pseudoclavibacter helvolus]|uniref:tape measure protein n=1 Tax=Pseudoclavibacter helvolus TaxID=255205 RepID=UPI003C706945
MGPELAAVYVSVLPSTSQIADGMVKGVEAAGPRIDGATRSIWDRMSSGMVTGLKVGAVAAGAGVAAAVTTAVSSGFERLVTIDTARSKLGALGHDAASVQGIMDNALASVKGTAFGLGDAATAASSAVAAGIPAGQELEKYLKSVGDTAAIAGVEFSDMGSIFNQVQSGQKAYTAELNQLRDRGLPIYQWIAEEAGVTADEVSKMASEGQISSELFFSAIDKNVGGAAGVMGQTSFVGAWDNVWAAVSRVGAAFLDAGGEGGGFFSQLKPLLGDATSMLDAITPKAAALGVAFGGFVAGAVAWIRELSSTLDFSSWDAFLASLGGGSGALSSIGASITTLTPAFQEFGAQMPEIGSSMVTLFTSVVPLVAGALGFLADNIDTIIAWMPVLVAGFVAWRVASSAFTAAQVAQAPILLASNTLGLSRALIDMQVARSTAAATTAQVANTAATNGGLLANVRATAALVAQRVAMVATSVATKAAAAAQWLMNAAMSANPIMLVVLAIAALVAGLVWFFTQTELGQAIWTEFTRFLGEAWNNIVAVATTVFTFLGAFFTNVWNGIVTAVQFVWGLIVGYITWYINTVMLIITTVLTAIVAAWNWLWNGIVTVFQFVWNLVVLAVTTYINIVMTIITTVLNVITTVWTNIWNGISIVISTVWGWIVAGVTAYITLVQTVITNVVNAISTTWNTVWGAISVFFMSLWGTIVRAVEGFVNEVQGRITQVTNFLQALPEQIMGFFTGIGEWLVESGKSLIQGFLDGISSAFEGAKGFVEDGLAGIRDLFPFSPAKEGPFSGRGWVAYSGMSVGETFGQSVASALNSEKSGVVSALGGIQSEFDSFDGSATASLGVDRFGDVAFARNAQRASYDFAAGEAQFGAGQGGNTTVHVNGDGLPASAVGEVVVQKLANAWR